MSKTETAFHSGEHLIQTRANVPADHIAMASSYIRSAMPDQHRAFFADQLVLFMGLLDSNGRVWATFAAGAPGFIQSPSDDTLLVRGAPVMATELGLLVDDEAKIGAVGIDLGSRRRNRLNGTLKQSPDGLLLAVDQSFGNCPQYIQMRDAAWARSADLRYQGQKIAKLTAQVRAVIEQADTFIIASRVKDISDDPRAGVDASHRGGRRGFLGIGNDGRLSFPDFAGNRFFNTLGNIEADGRVGLFIPDFDSGAAVFVTGRATIDWSSERVSAFEGAERIIDVAADEIWLVADAVSQNVTLIESWPTLQSTGTWNDVTVSRFMRSDGYSDFQIAAKHRESDTITSFYLTPNDGGPLEAHIAGQFLPIRLQSDGQAVLRTYTISQAPNARDYCLSVKRETHGAGSRLLHDQLQVGDTIEAASPAGDFVLDDSQQAVVLLSAGVGVTPMIAMLDDLIARVENGATPRQTWFVHAAQNGRNRAFQNYLETVASRYDWFHWHTVFSQPEACDIRGQDYDEVGVVSTDTLSTLLPFGGYQFYLCGPDGFMCALYQQLRDAGVDRDHIHYEFFGAGSLEHAADVDTREPLNEPSQVPVEFRRSGAASQWSGDSGSLLELAEAAGLSPSFNCRSGKCGTCVTRLLEGDVRYRSEPALKPVDGQVLICCAVPASDSPLVLDL